MIAAFSLIGFMLSLIWKNLIKRQSNYFEFCRKLLRNCEKTLILEGNTLDYYTLESFVFYNILKNKVGKTNNNINAISASSKKDSKYNEFIKTKEEYPENNKIGQRKSLGKLGLIQVDKLIVSILLLFWIFAFLFFLTMLYRDEIKAVSPKFEYWFSQFYHHSTK
jgi:hypothetical protein